MWIPAIGWMALIFALSSLPASRVPGRFGTWAHLLEYAVLSGLLLIPLGRTRRWALAALLAVAVSSAYGVTDEFHQVFVPGRDPSLADWVADTLGATLTAGGWSLMRKAARRRPS